VPREGEVRERERECAHAREISPPFEGSFGGMWGSFDGM